MVQSPTQVGLVLINFLCQVLRETEPPRWNKIHQSYDNMLNLLRESLSLEGDLANVWLKINKVIDELHETRIQGKVLT